MNKLVDSKIENLIYEVRGKQVMLDSDLARLYGCKNGTKSINLAVKRHINRFPGRFMFQLTEIEHKNLKFHFETSSCNNYGGVRKLPYAFTEQGVAMLATVLKTEKAEEVSVKIMDAFILMRQYISNSLIDQKHINELVIKNSKRIDVLEDIMNNFKTKSNHIFYEGQIYDAYSLLLDILESSKESIIIIDNYADKKLLDLLSKTKKQIKIYSKNMDKELISKYSSQYNNVEIVENDTFHDRFIIIDNKYLYHCGASFKELGKKCFAISKIDDEEILEIFISKI